MWCMRRPPSRLPRVLASLGKTSSVISDRESATFRGGSTGSTDSIEFKCRQLRPRMQIECLDASVADKTYSNKAYSKRELWTKLRCLHKSWSKTRQMPLPATG